MRLISDNDFRRTIVAGLLLRQPQTDHISLVEVGLARAHDLVVLEYAARSNRILVTHDVNSMVGFAKDRLDAGLPMAGLLAIHQRTPVRFAIEALELVCGASEQAEWEGQIVFLG